MTKLFDNISEKNKEKLLRNFHGLTSKFEKNANIIPYINRKNTIGIILHGSINVNLVNSDGTINLVDELKTDDIFSSLISSVILDEDCQIIPSEETIITFIDYNDIMDSEISKNDYYITFIHNLLNIISNQISLKNERISILVKKNIREKLLTFFSIEMKKRKSKIFTLENTLTDLARYIAVDRTAMTRELKNLNNEGIIESKGRTIKIKYDI